MKQSTRQTIIGLCVVLVIGFAVMLGLLAAAVHLIVAAFETFTVLRMA